MLDVKEWLSIFQEDDLFSQTDQIVLDGVAFRVFLAGQFACFSDPRQDRFDQTRPVQSEERRWPTNV